MQRFTVVAAGLPQGRKTGAASQRKPWMPAAFPHIAIPFKPRHCPSWLEVVN